MDVSCTDAAFANGSPCGKQVRDALIADRLALHEPHIDVRKPVEHVVIDMYGGTTMSMCSRGAGPSIAHTSSSDAVRQRSDIAGELLGGNGHGQ